MAKKKISHRQILLFYLKSGDSKPIFCWVYRNRYWNNINVLYAGVTFFCFEFYAPEILNPL